MWGTGVLILLIVVIRLLWVVLIARGKACILNFLEAFCLFSCRLFSTIHVGWPSFAEQDAAMNVVLQTDFEACDSALCIGLPFGCVGKAFEGSNVGVNITILHL